MKSVSCIGILMGTNGIVSPLECAFAIVSKMLTGKKFSMNVLVLRFIVMELLKDFVEDQTFFWKKSRETRKYISGEYLRRTLGKKSYFTSIPDDFIYSCG